MATRDVPRDDAPRFTGERFLPGIAPADMAPTHYGRYAFACQFVGGRHVLDLACGEGYGSYMMAEAGAASVLGVDVDPGIVDFAAGKYKAAQLSFAASDACSLALPDGAVDAVVSFETIEHVPEPERCVAEVARVLKPGGTYIVSTPNRLAPGPNTPPTANTHNPFHLREYALSEFRALLEGPFQIGGLYSQMPMTLGLRLLRTARNMLQPLGVDAAARYVFGAVSRTLASQRPVLPVPLPDAYRQDSWDQPVYFIALTRRRD